MKFLVLASDAQSGVDAES